MVAPVAAVAPVLTLANKVAGATGITGSLADLASLGFTIADHLKAQEGLKFNSHAFVLDYAVEKTPVNNRGSLSVGKRERRSAGVPRPDAQSDIRLQETSFAPAILEIKSEGALARFRLFAYVRWATSGPLRLAFVVHLSDIKGFDSEVGDQAEVEFSGVDVEGGYLLSMKGFVNEWLSGFMHFYADLLVRPAPLSGEIVTPLKSATQGSGGSIWSAQEGFVLAF